MLLACISKKISREKIYSLSLEDNGIIVFDNKTLSIKNQHNQWKFLQIEHCIPILIAGYQIYTEQETLAPNIPP